MRCLQGALGLLLHDPTLAATLALTLPLVPPPLQAERAEKRALAQERDALKEQARAAAEDHAPAGVRLLLSSP